MKDKEMAETLSEQLAEYRANWRVRVPADRQALIDQHVAHLTATGIDRTAKQVGDRAPAIRLRDQHGEDFDIADLLAKGPVLVTFYRGGWCPFCNLELKAYQAAQPPSRRPARARWRSARKSRTTPSARPKRTH